MAKCARCRMDLIGSARFCASCGAPVPEVDRRDAGPGTITGTPVESASRATTMDAQISIQVLDPGQPVNPFASTASPDSLVNRFATTKKPSLVDMPSAPPPGIPTPVSPLATSASLPDRGAFEELMATAQAEPKAASPAPVKKKSPGTQMMNNAPARPSTPAPVPAKKAVPRTVAMGNWTAPKPPSAPMQPAAVPIPAPSASRMPVSVAAPSALPGSALPASAVASSGLGSGQVIPSGQPSYPQAPSGPGGWGWNAPQQPPRPVVPGARVNVTWSNGQRYPATVNQINGPRCLVVFPDGQQHWVESQFVTAI